MKTEKQIREELERCEAFQSSRYSNDVSVGSIDFTAGQITSLKWVLDEEFE